ncbi:MAG TPA: hypothetical protein VGQ96_02670, partial [Candidatus Eremiobacteraceae bacterium]|nr:hypothetical protein [Candidatus Eremiobacteraceae bacterium]
MDTHEHDQDPILEIVDASGDSVWTVAPGEPAEYPICIRNGTSETHDVEVVVADPIDWARITPSRMALAPGTEAVTTLVLAMTPHGPIPAGEQYITLELRDFEGTRFGQLVGRVDVRPYYRLEMSLSARGPLVRRELVEGFIVHCTLVNRGNAECFARLRADGGEHLTLGTPKVSVPVGGEVSFDIEAHWKFGLARSYPPKVLVWAEYQEAEVYAEL